MKKFLSAVALLLSGPILPAAQLLPHNIPFLCAGSPDNIPAGQTVTLTGVLTKGCIEVPAGSTLILGNGLDLSVTTIQTLPGSSIRTASGATNIRVTIRDVPTNSTNDPEQYGTGLVILGDYNLSGAVLTSWTKLTASLPAGATSAPLASTAGMVTGQQLCFGESRYTSDDVVANKQCVTITDISANTVIFTPANQVERRPILNHDFTVVDYAPVAYMHRPVVIRSANPGGTRGHIIVSGQASGTFDGVAVLDMGRTRNDLTAPGSQQVGRYPLHWHHNPGAGSFVNGLIRGSLKWGISAHQSSNKLMQNNVCMDSFGWCFGTEDGLNETGVVIDRNLVINVDGDGNRGDRGKSEWRNNPLLIGTSNVGIWLARPDVTVTNNVIMNTIISCIMGWGDRVTPLALQRGNTCYASRRGVTLWDITGGVIEDFTSSNAWAAIDNYATKDITYRRWIVRGDPARPGVGQGYSSGDYSTMGNVIDGWDVQNVGIGIQAPWAIADDYPGMSTTPRFFEVRDSTFCNNGVDIRHTIVAQGSSPTLAKPLHTTTVRNVSHCDKTQYWVAVTGLLQQNPGDAIPVMQVDNFNRVEGDDFTVHSKEHAPSGATTKPRVLDLVVGGITPPPPADTDNDGIPDSTDRCPTSPANTPSGCPDLDGDGIVDIDDKCPTTAAPGTADGCPVTVPDGDKDGVPDSIDKCPTQPGPDTNGGCPVAQSIIVTIQAPTSVTKPTLLAFTSTCEPNCVRMDMFVDGVSTGQFQNSAPWNWNFNSANYSPGPHVIGLVGSDAAGNQGQASHTIVVIDPTAPTLQAPTVTATPTTCQYTATAEPPPGGGYTAQFQRKQTTATTWSSHGNKDSVTPYIGTARLAFTTWEFRVIWSKTGEDDQTSPVRVQTTCSGG